MKVFQVLPRRMSFSHEAASSIELCVSDWVSGSRYLNETSIVAEAGGNPLMDINILRLRPARYMTSWALAFEIKRFLKSRPCDIIVKQQHISTGARIAFFNKSTPVIVQTLNYVDPPAKGFLAPFKNFIRRQELRSLSGITFMSEACRKDFETQWPQIKLKSALIFGGFDFSVWHPSFEREKCILVVGRCVDDKGVLESAEAVVNILRRYQDWKAVFVLSSIKTDPEYYQRVIDTLKPVGERIQVWTNVLFEQVRAISETAAIAIVASKWNEPFGRTALEAHAGGAALISSGSGGLSEISGPHAVYLNEVTVDEIVRATESLINDPDKRAAMAEAAGRHVRERFSIHPEPGNTRPTISQTLDDFLDSVVAARPRS